MDHTLQPVERGERVRNVARRPGSLERIRFVEGDVVPAAAQLFQDAAAEEWVEPVAQGWVDPATGEWVVTSHEAHAWPELYFAKYGWVCEHDPYDPEYVGRKHTALGRFRHENTAFRHEPGKQFVLYMGDDKANEGVYKFVSARSRTFSKWTICIGSP